MKSHHKKIVWTFLKFSISVALLFWVIRKTNLTEVLDALGKANIYLLIVAFFISCVSYYLRAYRWRNLLLAKQTKFKISYLFKSYLVGIFFSNFLPSIVGGDAIRVYDIWRLKPQEPKSIAITTVLVDRVLGLITLMLFALGALLIVPQASLLLGFPRYYVLLGIIAFIGVIVLPQILLKEYYITSFLEKIKLPGKQKTQQKIIDIVQAFLSFSDHKNYLLKAFAWSFPVQIAVISHYYLIARSLNMEVPFTTFFLIVPLATVIVMLPLSINGIGLRENAFVFLLGTYGTNIGRSETIALTWLVYGIIVIQGLIGAVINMIRK